MKVQKKDLVAALGRISHIPKSTPTQATRCFLLEAADGILTISATSFDQHASQSIPCVGDIDKTLVPANAFTSIVTYGSEEQVFSLTDKGRLHCEVGAVIDTPIIVDDWSPPIADKMRLLAVNCADLADCIKKVAWCASTDKGRQELNCVHIRLEPTKIFTEAFSGTEGAFCERAAIAETAEFILSNDFAASFQKALTMEGAQLSISESWLNVWYEGGTYSCKLVENRFPKTDQIISAERTLLAWIDRDQWLDIFRCIQSTRGPQDELSLKTIIAMGTPTCEFQTVPGDGGSDYHKSIDGKFPEITLRLNALAFVKCLASFPDGSTIAIKHIKITDAVVLEHEDVAVMTSQLRPDAVKGVVR
jgi:DNA polymerase III sliding clamp (beta) subunit (PCNA family)